MSKNDAYYYSRLSAMGKTVYNAIASGIKTFSADIALPFVPQNEISTAFDAVIWDNPLILFRNKQRSKKAVPDASQLYVPARAKKQYCNFRNVRILKGM